MYGNDCISDSGSGKHINFEHVFDLSWTTFSTVGYGVVSPNLGEGCYVFRFVCSVEAFFGVLYTATCSAILYSRMTRIQAKASVVCSDVMCLLYGDGLKEQYHTDKGQSQSLRDSFLYIEFRINNQHCNGSPFLNAVLTCNVLLPTPKLKPNCNDIDCESNINCMNNQEDTISTKYELKIDNSDMEYFDNVWYIRHVLDKDSPLVKDNIRRVIAEFDVWPSRLNDYVSIRESLKEFQKIVVLFSGIDAATACSVYAQKYYEFEDIYVGWKFTRLCSKAQVDLSAIHNIMPQGGGGHEPISEE